MVECSLYMGTQWDVNYAGDIIGRKLFTGRHRTCEAKVECQAPEFFLLMYSSKCS